MSVDVVTFGEVMALFLARAGNPLEHATSFDRQFAGAESNVAVALARLGLRVRWLGRVGEDPLGRAAVRFLRGEDVDVRVAIDPDRPTGLLVRDHDGARPVDVVYGRTGSAGSALSAGDLPAEVVSDARLVHLTGITPVLSESACEAALAAVTAARAAGVTVSFDPNLRRRLATPERAAEVLRPFAALADLVLTGLDEAQVLSGADSRSAAARWFLDRGARLVVVKDGAAGSWATDGESEWSAGALPVAVVDPVGAGDAFDAGFLAAWLDGLDPGAALMQAAAVAACVVRTRGDTDGLPTRAQLADLLGGAPDVRR